MKKTYNLSFVLDKKGKKRVDLASYNKLEELDDFIMSNFVTTEDVRKKYQEVIKIFTEKNNDIIEAAKEKGRKYRGYIVITYDDGNEIRKIPVMYKDGRKIKSIAECLEIFNEKYNDKQIIKKIKTDKSSVFTGEELARLKNNYYLDYLQWGSDDKKRFDDFASMFYKRVITKSETDSDLYYHFRYMMDYFPFGIGKNKEHVVITDIKEDKLSKMERNKIYHDLYQEKKEIIKYSEIKTPEREGVEVSESAPDDFKYVFYKALDTGDFDMLFNMYSLEEIERYTNLIQGKRK